MDCNRKKNPRNASTDCSSLYSLISFFLTTFFKKKKTINYVILRDLPQCALEV